MAGTRTKATTCTGPNSNHVAHARLAQRRRRARCSAHSRMMIKTTPSSPPTLNNNKSRANEEKNKIASTQNQKQRHAHTREPSSTCHGQHYSTQQTRGAWCKQAHDTEELARTHTHSQTHARNLRTAYVGARRASPSRFPPPTTSVRRHMHTHAIAKKTKKPQKKTCM